jgi:hypothetical protein
MMSGRNDARIVKPDPFQLSHQPTRAASDVAAMLRLRADRRKADEFHQLREEALAVGSGVGNGARNGHGSNASGSARVFFRRSPGLAAGAFVNVEAEGPIQIIELIAAPHSR